MRVSIKMKTNLLENEDVEYESAANHQKNIETIGGKLYLTNERLVFEPHGLNIQKQKVKISLSDIYSVETRWTKFLGFLPLAPNAFIVCRQDGIFWSFTVNKRKNWIKKINEAKSKNQGVRLKLP